MADDLAARWHAARDLEDEAGQRVGLLLLVLGKKVDRQQVFERREVDAAVGEVDPLLDRLDLQIVLRVVLVRDVADDDLDEILDRDEPSVPPYSSMTMARWVRLACMRTSRSVAGMEGGTNRTSRLRPACLTVVESAVAAILSPGGGALSGFSALSAFSAFVARRLRVPRAAIQRRKSLTWIMPVMPSSVSR